MNSFKILQKFFPYKHIEYLSWTITDRERIIIGIKFFILN